MKKSKTNIVVLILLILAYAVLWFIQFTVSGRENSDAGQIMGIVGSAMENPEFPNQFKSQMGEVMGSIGKNFLHTDTSGASGIIAQFLSLVTVLLVITSKKAGFIASVVLNGANSIYTLIYGVIIRGNTGALPGVVIPIVCILTNTILFFYINKTVKMHEELNESYEQAIENNRIIQEKDEVLSYLAYYDRLTQMPNRHLFMDNLEGRVTNSEEHTVIYANIDNFRNINDPVGHSVGDELLVKFAQRIEGLCGEEIFSAKIGGDEFGFILPAEYKQNDIIDFIGKLQGVFGEAIELKGTRFSLTASFGAASFPADAGSSEDLFRCAETAMFAAKTNGKNQLCFYIAR